MNLPPTLTKERIRRCFDRARDTYVKAAMVQAGVAETCARNVPRGHYPAIIEIGAGGGVLTHRVAARCSHERYLGVDISPGMLAQIDKSDLTCPEFVAADAEYLDVAAHTFDLLVSSSTFQWYRTPERSIPDNFRLLRSGGCFSIAIFIDGTFPEITAASGATGFGSLLPLRTDAFYGMWLGLSHRRNSNLPVQRTSRTTPRFLICFAPIRPRARRPRPVKSVLQRMPTNGLSSITKPTSETRRASEALLKSCMCGDGCNGWAVVSEVRPFSLIPRPFRTPHQRWRGLLPECLSGGRLP